MIEDEAALTCIDEILKVKGIDAVFIGRGDLSAALGRDRANVATKRIIAAAQAASVPAITVVSSTADAAAMRDSGITAYVVSNDQNFMKSAAALALKDYGDASAW